MSFQPIFSPWAVLLLAVILGALCVAGWRATRTAQSDRRARWEWLRRGGIVALITLIALGPAIPRDEVSTYASGVEIYFVVDRTGSMAAEDYGVDGETRLSGVRADMRAITAENTGARFSIISFDSIASQQLPLSTDARAVNAWADTLTQEITALSSGSLIDRPLASLSRALADSEELSPAHERYVYFFSDGENTADGERSSFESLARYLSGGAVLGYGTAEGGRMRINDPTGAQSGYIIDPTLPGEPEAISKMDEASLRAVADELSVEYIHRDPATPIDTVLLPVVGDAVNQETARTVRVYQPLLWPFALAIAALLIWEVAATVRRTTRPVGVRHE